MEYFLHSSKSMTSGRQILIMEMSMLNRMFVEPNRSHTLCPHGSKAAGSYMKLEQMVLFFAMMALMQYGLVVIASGSICCAR